VTLNPKKKYLIARTARTKAGSRAQTSILEKQLRCNASFVTASQIHALTEKEPPMKQTELSRRHIATLIQKRVSFFNGWGVSVEREREACTAAAKDIIEYAGRKDNASQSSINRLLKGIEELKREAEGDYERGYMASTYNHYIDGKVTTYEQIIAAINSDEFKGS